ncbi:opsin 9 [Aulostomus maculatus]
MNADVEYTAAVIEGRTEGVTSVLGNGLVLLVHFRRRKKFRPPELMIINLALCDFGFSFLGVPFFIISSLCHAWVFGEIGCLWYGIQGFVCGIGSLLTTCLISLDRCLKICCLRYGQWIEKRHVSLSIALVWLYTTFWAFLPALGFGSYGPEPYGTSCTINWWRIRWSLPDRIYIFLVLTLCFGLPTLAIITSYLAILSTVFRSNRSLASIPSSSVSHMSKDLKLAKIAAVLCTTFLLAWMPYATVSLISAFIPSDEYGLERYAEVENSAPVSNILDISPLVNCSECYTQIHYSPAETVSDRSNMSEGASVTRSPEQFSCLPPVVTLIPAMFAKSHCMINPFIYQIMNREFRFEVYVMVFGREKAERKTRQERRESEFTRNISVSYCNSWGRKRSNPTSLSGEKRNRSLETEKERGRSSWICTISVDMVSLDIQGNMERQSAQREATSN